MREGVRRKAVHAAIGFCVALVLTSAAYSVTPPTLLDHTGGQVRRLHGEKGVNLPAPLWHFLTSSGVRELMPFFEGLRARSRQISSPESGRRRGGYPLLTSPV